MLDSNLTTLTKLPTNFTQLDTLPLRARDISGMRQGGLVAIRYIGYRTCQRKKYPDRPYNLSLWLCQCDCGKFTVVDLGRFVQHTRISCGCIRKTQNKTHGQASQNIKSSEYNTWRGIMGRCFNPNNIGFKAYGARGITMCAGWKHNFEAFFNDMGVKPSKSHSLDRINNNGGYWCGHCEECLQNGQTKNCRWATPKEQRYNQRICAPCLSRIATLSIEELIELRNELIRTLAA